MRKVKNLKELGEYLKSKRESENLSYYQLVKDNKIHIKTIQRLEKGEPARTNKLFDLLENLEIEIFLNKKGD